MHGNTTLNVNCVCVCVSEYVHQPEGFSHASTPHASSPRSQSESSLFLSLSLSLSLSLGHWLSDDDHILNLLVFTMCGRVFNGPPASLCCISFAPLQFPTLRLMSFNFMDSLGIFTLPSRYGRGLAHPAISLSCLCKTEGVKSPFVTELAEYFYFFMIQDTRM